MISNDLANEMADIFYISDDEKKRLMHIRANNLAVEPENENELTGTIDVVEFDLAHEKYGIESKWIKEVFPLKDLTPIPCTPSFILGITSIRGQIIPVTDVKLFFDLPTGDITNLNRLMVIKSDDMTLGILADSVESVRQIRDNDIYDCPGGNAHKRNEYLKGVTKDHLIILDIKKILSDPKIKVDEEV